ncbi:MAG: SpoIIE family protein phosphatase [Candidatus Coproplasma sp.]
MKEKRKFTKSLIRPIFNALIGLIMLLSFAIGIVGYFEFSNALKEQYAEIANGIAKYVALEIDAQTLDVYLESKTTDGDYDEVREQLQRTADSEDCKVIYVAKVHTDTKEREYIYNVVSKTSGYSPYAIGYRDTASEGILNAYSALINGESDIRNLMYSREGYTTSVYPVKDNGGKVVAIVGVVKDMTLLNTAKSNYIIQVVLIEVGIAIVSGILWVIYMRRRIVTPIRQLNQASLHMVEHLEDGTSPEIIVKKDDEIKDLADCFSKMYGEIGEYISKIKTITAEKERIGAELDVAAKIQSSMLPCIFPPFPNRKEFDIYATMDPAKEVGGDFYDFFMVDEDHLAFVVADVSGKGVPAALFMVIGKTLIKDHTGLHSDLGEVFTEVNDILCASNSEEMFITAFEGVLNLKTGELRYVNAGHETPFICRKNGVYEPFKVKSGFVLAGMNGIRYKSGSIQLEPGDKIFEYSDGVPEATNADNEQYGMKRLAAVLARESRKTPAELLPLIKSDLDAFVKDAEQFDDITMLCVQFNGTGKNAEISVKPDKDSIQTVAVFVEKTMDEWKIPKKTATKVQIAVDEIFSNIVNYSGANNAKLTVINRDEKLLLTFEDDGIPYDPTTTKEPDITLTAEEREVGGLGIFMVKKMASDVRYEYKDGKNVLTVETVIPD